MQPLYLHNAFIIYLTIQITWGDYITEFSLQMKLHTKKKKVLETKITFIIL